MKKLIVFAAMLAGFCSYAQTPLTKNDLEELKNRLEGNFDTEEQSKNDISYQNRALRMKEIDLKGRQPDGYWLYVEEAPASSTEIPIRQFVTRLYKLDKETLAADIYTMSEPLRFAGAWHSPNLLKKLTLDSLNENKGCTILIHKDADGNFFGKTNGKECMQEVNGAAYFTSELAIYQNMLIVWDKGWSREDKQIAGAEKAGYRFRKWTTPRRAKD
ncbi:MAG TPA: chromophore lyase CpcT/CpeT [Flavipsychrobacter sp.]|nr:chromophore lyase CpcT/CpeT [Flavipsychrobacter sp.]